MVEVVKYRLTEASIMLGVARHQLLYLIAKRRIPQPTIIKGDRYYSEADLEATREFLRTWVKWAPRKKEVK